MPSKRAKEVYRRETGCQYPAGLGCGIVKLEYCFLSKHADLYLPDGHCTDMEGALRLVLAIDPEACRIRTWSGEWKDTEYRKGNEGWYALPPPRKRAGPTKTEAAIS